MSSTNKTPNYGLPQYIDTDKPTFLGDFNDAMGIIDKGMNDNKILLVKVPIKWMKPTRELGTLRKL